jgi:hypothetical protein
MLFSGILRHAALVRTGLSEEPSASIIRVTRISELVTTLAVTSNRSKLRRNTDVCSYESHTASHHRTAFFNISFQCLYYF